jgi:hypothetical protein
MATAVVGPEIDRYLKERRGFKFVELVVYPRPYMTPRLAKCETLKVRTVYRVY